MYFKSYGVLIEVDWYRVARVQEVVETIRRNVRIGRDFVSRYN